MNTCSTPGTQKNAFVPADILKWHSAVGKGFSRSSLLGSSSCLRGRPKEHCHPGLHRQGNSPRSSAESPRVTVRQGDYVLGALTISWGKVSLWPHDLATLIIDKWTGRGLTPRAGLRGGLLWETTGGAPAAQWPVRETFSLGESEVKTWNKWEHGQRWTDPQCTVWPTLGSHTLSLRHLPILRSDLLSLAHTQGRIRLHLLKGGVSKKLWVFKTTPRPISYYWKMVWAGFLDPPIPQTSVHSFTCCIFAFQYGGH